MRFELFIATRYLRAKRRQAFIGVITGISILGVAAGVASLIIALAINNGFRQDLQDRLLETTSHVTLLRVQDDGIKDWRQLLERLSHQPHVIAAAPTIYEEVMISRGPQARGAVLKGITPSSENRVSDLLKSVVAGSADALNETEEERSDSATSNAKATSAGEGARATQTELPDSLQGVQDRLASMPPIILGKDMAESLGAEVGSVVLVTSPQGELTPFGMVPKYSRFRVAGIFNSGFYDYDSSWSLARLSDSQRLFGIGDQIAAIEFKVDDIYKAGEIGDQLEQAAGKGFMSKNWMEQNKALFRALRMERLYL
jgi:lipoprotein-releasing system permease protein